MSIDQAIIEQGLLAARPADGRTMEVDELHRFLSFLEATLGARPQQVVDGPLRVRWFALDQHRQPQGQGLRIRLRPSAAQGQLVWSVGVESISDEDLRRERLDIKFLGDPDMGGEPPYLLNLRVGPAETWVQDDIVELGEWGSVDYYLARLLSELPAALAAFPAA